MLHVLHCYDRGDQPYETVRREVLADPYALFPSATSAGPVGEVHVRIGAIELGAEIAIEIRGVDENRESLDRPKTTVTLDWRSKQRALFPVMTATFTIYPVTPTTTRVEL